MMHKKVDVLNLYPAILSSILNVIFAEITCDKSVSAYGSLCFVPFLVGFTCET